MSTPVECGGGGSIEIFLGIQLGSPMDVVLRDACETFSVHLVTGEILRLVNVLKTYPLQFNHTYPLQSNHSTNMLMFTCGVRNGRGLFHKDLRRIQRCEDTTVLGTDEALHNRFGC